MTRDEFAETRGFTFDEYIKKAKEYGYTDKEIKERIEFIEKMERKAGRPVPTALYDDLPPKVHYGRK